MFNRKIFFQGSHSWCIIEPLSTVNVEIYAIERSIISQGRHLAWTSAITTEPAYSDRNGFRLNIYFPI